MIRYEKFGRVELNVTDLPRARRFYEEVVGLQFVGTGAQGEVLLRCDHDHHNVILHAARSAGLRVAGFMLQDEAQFAPLRACLEEAGLEIRDVPAQLCASHMQQHALRVFEPLIGAVVEFYLPSAEAARPFRPSVARIQRLGHVVFNTPRAAEAIAFWRDIMNFRTSDAVGEMVTFMRVWPNPWHHGIGIANSSAYSLHHVNYMVSEIDDIGRALARLRKAQSPVVFGPGRHPASESVFLYFLDPDNLTMEYSFGMESFPEDFARQARQLPLKPEWLDAWGSERDPRCFTGAGPNASLKMDAVML